MKRPSTLLRLVAIVGLITVMFAGVVTTASASPTPSGGMAAIWDRQTKPGIVGQNESDNCVMADDLEAAATAEPGVDFLSSHNLCDGSQEVYFASVAAGDDVDGAAGAIPTYNTSITVQNLDADDAYAFVYVEGQYYTYAYLSGGASKTFSAESLGIGSTPVPVVVSLYHVLVSSVTCVAVATGGFLCTAVDPGSGEVFSFPSAVEVSSTFKVGANVAGVAKQVAGTSTTANTTADDVTVSGYNAVSGREVGFFDQLYLPIVQTNCGPGGCWDTRIDIANVGIDANAAATLVFFPANDASGSLNTGFQIETDQAGSLNAHHTMTITLSDYVPEGWVGSVHIMTDDAVVAIANRFKSGTQMWITNTASNAASESDWQHSGLAGGTLGGNFPYALFASDVRMDFNGWNTGINVANTVDEDNEINIQYFGNNGNAGQGLTQRLAAQGMTYFYNPSDPSEDDCQQPAGQVPTCDFVGAAVILSEYPVAVAVDGVKYFGENADDQNIGQAFTYAASGNVFNLQAMPLVQKGNPANGMGATSGINFLNPNDDASMISVRWVNPSGFSASNFGNAIVYVPGFSTGFVYTMFQQNLPNGFRGSALVTSTQPIAATSANVDYQVQADGTTVWNLYNPCGLFRQLGDCAMAQTPPPGGNTGGITKTVVDTAGNVVAGATILVTGTAENGDTFASQLVTNASGQATFVVPFGTFNLSITGLPTAFTNPVPNPADNNIVISASNTNVAITDVVNIATGQKTIDTAKPGALICVFGPGGTAQDPKAPATPGPCFPFNVFEKGPNGGGQGQPTTFGASLNNTGATASLSFVASTQVLSWDINIPNLAAGTNVAAIFVGQAICATDFTGNLDPNNPAPGFESLALGSTTANGDLSDRIVGSTQLDATQLNALGNFDEGVVVIYNTLNGAILGCGNIDAGTVRPATTDEIAAAFGAAAVAIANGQGDATFNLPPGCYVAVTFVPNHQAATEPFCVEAGVARTDTVEIEPVTGPVFGTLTKTIDVSAFDPFIGGAGDLFTLQSEIAFCSLDTLAMLGVNTASGGAIAASGECNDAADPAVEAYGGFDNLYNQIAPTFQMSAQVPVGDYAICLSIAVTGPFNPAGPNETLFTDYHCEITSAGGPITVTAGHETVVTNDAAANAVGSLDVTVRGGAALGGIAGAQVCLFDQNGNLVDCNVTGANGTAHFAVGSGTYTATATAMGFGSLSATCVYDVLDDAFGTGAAPTATCNVGVAAGIVDQGSNADIILTLAPVNGTLTVTATITGPGGTAPSAGTVVFVAPAAAAGAATADVDPTDPAALTAAAAACGIDTSNPLFPLNLIVGASAAVTDDTGQVTFSLAPGTYCVIGDSNKDGLVDFAPATVPSGGNADATLDDAAALQIDVQVSSTDPGEPGGVTVNLYEADCLTQIGDSAPTGADGMVDFGPVVPAVIVPNTYCVGVIDPDTGLETLSGPFLVPAGDAGGDVDVVVDITGP